MASRKHHYPQCPADRDPEDTCECEEIEDQYIQERKYSAAPGNGVPGLSNSPADLIRQAKAQGLLPASHPYQ